MSQIPGPRTSPTVNSGSQRGKRPFEVRLGLVQVVILLGVVTGSMACVFFVGFVSGQHVGYQTALNSSVANAVKLPISEEMRDKSGTEEQVAAKVYAKLDESSSSGHGEAPAQMPELGSIQNLENAPVVEPTEEADETPAELEPVIVGEESTPTKKTLKDMLAGQEKTASVEVQDKKVEEVHTNDDKISDDKKLGLNEDTIVKEKEDDRSLAALKKREKEEALEEKVSAKPTAIKELPTPVEKKATLVPTPRVPSIPTASQAASQAPKVSGGKGWFAQVAAPKKESDATELASQLRSSGFSVRIEVAQVGGEQYYRVMVGPEESKPQADRLIQQLKREKYLKSDPFLKLVR